MTSLKQKLAYLAATAIPIYLWAKLIQNYLKYKQQIIEKKKTHNKHNCVVTYSKDSGMFGWPEYPERLPLNLSSYDKFLEPVLYFIDTAKYKLDVSVMILNCQNIIDALVQAAERNVKIRLILDARYNDVKQKMRLLVKKGEFLLFWLNFIIIWMFSRCKNNVWSKVFAYWFNDA